ncbi:hypothetical protein NL676_035267 [Syzygium grande]|nr:hypothetical protein NL676_035267 [Syzygium grande]
METGGDSDPCNWGTEQAADLRANESHGASIDPLPFTAKEDGQPLAFSFHRRLCIYSEREEDSHGFHGRNCLKCRMRGFELQPMIEIESDNKPIPYPMRESLVSYFVG